MIGEIFSAEERRRFEEHMRPLVERGAGIVQSSHVFLWAWKTVPSIEEL